MVYFINGVEFEKKIKGRERTRMMVRIRDNFICKDCGDERTPKQAKELKKRLFDIHHLNGLCGKKSRGYDKISEIDGLVTLCHKCHFNRPEHTSQIKKPKRPSKRDLYIYKIRHEQDLSFRKIGILYSLSHQRVSQIVTRIENYRSSLTSKHVKK